MLLNKFFYKFWLDSNDDFFEFLYSKRIKVLDTLKNRKNKVSFLTSTNSSEDVVNSKVLTEEATNNFSPVICTVTVDLFNNYTQIMRKEEAIDKTEPLRQ